MMTSSARCGGPIQIAVVLLTLVIVSLTGCASDRQTPAAPLQPDSPTASSVRSRESSPPVASPTTDPDAGVEKVLVVVEENRSVRDVTSHLPYLMSQAKSYGIASNYHAITHPSLPNYLAIAGGSTFGIRDDEDPDVHRITGPSLFGTVLASGHTAKTYADAMPRPCARHNNGTYGVRHNPWTYFADPAERADCQRYDLPAGSPTHGALADDVAAGTLPTFGLLIPDVCHDGHDCSGAATDRWLQTWLPSITTGPDFTSGRLAVIITWDEDDDHSGNQVPLIVLHPALHGQVVGTQLDHYALSAAIAKVAGVPPLRKAGQAPDLLAAFGLS